VEKCPKYEDENSSEKFSAKTKICQIDPRMPTAGPMMMQASGAANVGLKLAAATASMPSNADSIAQQVPLAVVNWGQFNLFRRWLTDRLSVSNEFFKL
jgi:hypothetical protein